MSWSASFTSVSADEISTLEPPNYFGAIDGQTVGVDQFEKARAIAAELVQSGVVGDPEKHIFNVSMSGHANPDHEPHSSYAPDAVNVSVNQVDPRYQPACTTA